MRVPRLASPQAPPHSTRPSPEGGSCPAGRALGMSSRLGPFLLPEAARLSSPQHSTPRGRAGPGLSPGAGGGAQSLQGRQRRSRPGAVLTARSRELSPPEPERECESGAGGARHRARSRLRLPPLAAAQPGQARPSGWAQEPVAPERRGRAAGASSSRRGSPPVRAPLPRPELARR